MTMELALRDMEKQVLDEDGESEIETHLVNKGKKRQGLRHSFAIRWDSFLSWLLARKKFTSKAIIGSDSDELPAKRKRAESHSKFRNHFFIGDSLFFGCYANQI